MKKVLFLFVCLFCFFCKVNANSDDIMYLNYIDDGTLLDFNQNVAYSYGTGVFMVTVFYVDSDGNVLEAFVNDGGRLSGVDEYTNFSFASFHVGETCKEAYLRFSEVSKNDEVKNWCERVMIYSSSYDLSLIKYWNKYSLSNDELISYCANVNELKDSYICKDIINGNSSVLHEPKFLFKEYEPVSFELVCEPKKVKKGETSNCELKVNASEEINELTIPMNGDLFDITKYNEVDGWELVDNKDGTITIKSEDGFKGEGVVLGATLKFKEDLTDDVEIVLDDIYYITADGIELNGNAKDIITIYEEPVVEDTKEEVDNPNTIDNVSLISILSLITIFIVLMIYRIKKIFR